MSLKQIIGELNKKYGYEAAVMVNSIDNSNVERVSTGILTLDLALGGGLPIGRTIEFYGPEGSGKSTLALYAVIEFCKAFPNKMVVYIDYEHALDIDLAVAYGVDADNLIIVHPKNGEDGIDMAEAFIRSEEVSLIVTDSVTSILPEAEESSSMHQQSMGLQARMMSKAMRKLTGIAANTKTTMIWINQLREKIGVMYGNPETTSGGRALKFYASVRLSIRAGERIKEGTEIIGHQTNVSVTKNKVGVPNKKASYNLIYGIGIDRVSELTDILITSGIFSKAGSWYSLVDQDGVLRQHEGLDLKFQGSAKLTAFLREHTDFFEEMTNLIST